MIVQQNRATTQKACGICEKPFETEILSYGVYLMAAETPQRICCDCAGKFAPALLRVVNHLNSDDESLPSDFF